MKKLILVSVLALLTAAPVAAQSITVGPGGVGVDVETRRDRDRRRWREDREEIVTGSTRRCRTVIREHMNSRGEMIERRTRECD